MATDMAMSRTTEFDLPPRKKPKVSDLPLSSAQRDSIDGMLHTFKRKGEFDALRKKAFQQYNESAQRGMFEASLRAFTTTEIDRDPVKYLKPDRRVGAPLLEGAAARGDVYKKTETDIDAYIDQYLASAERALRDIRRREIGEEAAEKEFELGNKSDEAYAAEAEERGKDRAKKHVEQERLRKKQEASERKKKELEALKKKQIELTQETERLQREQKRRAEREAWKVAEKQKERDRIQKYNEEREAAKKEQEDRERVAREDKERKQKEKAEREQKRLEQEALDLLLREGKEMAEKGKRPELERSESMEPPSRLLKYTAPRNSLSRDEMRAQGLMPTSMTLRKGDKPVSVPSGPRGDSSTATRDDDHRRRGSHLRSPSRSSYARRRDHSPLDDDRRSTRRNDTGKRETLYRDISAERAAWKARQRPRERDRETSRGGGGGGEEGEVVEASAAATRRSARSRSRESNFNSYRPARRESRSPPPRRNRRDSRSRSPPRFRDRDRGERRREDSLPRRRERSRSPPGIDRYVPGGSGGVAAAAVGGGGASARRRGDEERPARRREEDERSVRRGKEDEERERDRDRPSRRREDEDRETERRRRERDGRPSDIDRYIPGGGRITDDAVVGAEKPRTQRRERSRSRSRDRGGYREREMGKQDKDPDSAKEEKVVPETAKEGKVGEKEGGKDTAGEIEQVGETERKQSATEDVVSGAVNEQALTGDKKAEAETEAARESGGGAVH
ncbi:hypothetical protein LTR91_002223 [Friedmanniomyces endolithicus]|uniref:BOD1/SHG1 domain-containing protein n=1 Tax=Friedmanniomyces endolithicus TaxID=329885 RepID=A0AAN6L0P8_9PEZI|nr:hypothetical protein LTR35_015958 [Friedmanniomyces endolithicus]KAK0273555.1 hypothetical protein LTS00_015756 [Friedmanniomyces endolithicus]KAK0318215.1 hypothetical protein LTR82_010914 [Friedmanniomyces endolithicus]KAK0904467.1 hypothetical protein LTR57_018719 [Friedmanniomyces endolithicus]KAK1001145.1 hypothetical protein LTR54_008657 [Friedmanniomyces endolithicus]